MRFLSLCLGFVLFTSIGASAQPTNIEFPDYTKWTMLLDHSESYVYKGAPLQLRDQHYTREKEATVELTLVYFLPEDSTKEWFAIYMMLDKNKTSGELSGALFERKNGAWPFVQNLSVDELNDMGPVFKARYDLEIKKK
ncbi:MAG: hypothetical protein Q7S28_01920 [bacterium]|nr:hypothetical protein [bacterium]